MNQFLSENDAELKALRMIRLGMMIHWLNSAIALLFAFFIFNGMSNGIRTGSLFLGLGLLSYPIATVIVYLRRSAYAAGYLLLINVAALIAMFAHLQESGSAGSGGIGLSTVGAWLSAQCLLGTIQLRRTGR